MAFDPNTAKPVNAFDPNTAQLVESAQAPAQPAVQQAPQTQQPNIDQFYRSDPIGKAVSSAVDYIGSSWPIEKINALGGGVATGLADTASMAVTGKPTENFPLPDHVQEAVNQNPATYAAGGVSGLIAGATLATAAAAKSIAPMINTAMFMMGKQEIAGLTAGAITDIAANTLAGSILAGPGNRMFGASLGTLASGVGALVNSVGSKAVSVATVDAKTKQTVAQISSQVKGDAGQIAAQDQANMWNQSRAIEDSLASGFKSNAVTTIPANVSKQAAKILAEYNSPKKIGSLTNEQESILKKLIQWGKPREVSTPASTILDSSGQPVTPASIKVKPPVKFSFDDIHQARKELDQIISQAFSKADAGEISRDIAFNLKSLREPLIQDLETAANKAGVLSQFRQFNDYYQQIILPMMNSGAKDTAEALAAHTVKTDPMLGAKIIDTQLNKYITAKKPQQAAVWLSTLSPVGKTAAEVRAVNNALQKATGNNGIVDILAFKKQVGDIQTAIPSLFSDKTKTMVDGLNKVIDEASTVAGIKFDAAKINPITKVSLPIGTGVALGALSGAGTSGMVVGGAVAYAITKMVNSPLGQDMLIRASTEGGKLVTKSIVNGIILQQILKGTEDYKNPMPDATLNDTITQGYRDLTPVVPSQEQDPNQPTQTIGIRG